MKEELGQTNSAAQASPATASVKFDGNATKQQPTDDMVQCPACRGHGVVKKWPGDRSPDRDCKYCEGIGGVTEARMHAYHDNYGG